MLLRLEKLLVASLSEPVFDRVKVLGMLVTVTLLLRNFVLNVF